MTISMFLGSCIYEPKPYTRIQPLAVIEGGAWRVYENWEDALPEDGKVFSPRDPGFSVGEVFAFRVEPNLRPDPTRPDRFLFSDAHRVVEVLDFRHVEAEIARRAVVEFGLEGLRRGSERIIVALRDGVCVVVPLVTHPTADRSIAHLAGLSSLPKYLCDQALFSGDRIEGRYFEVPAVTVGQQVGTVDWSRDADFFEAVLKRLRRVKLASAQGSDASLPMTRTEIASLVSWLSRADLLPSMGADFAPTKARLELLSKSVELNVDSVAELIELVCELTPVKERLNAEIAKRRDDLELEVRIDLDQRLRKEIEDELHNFSNERERLKLEVTELEASLERGRQSLLEIQTAASSLQDCLSTEISSLQSDLGEMSSSAIDTARSMSARIAAKLNRVGRDIEIIPAQASPWSRSSDLPRLNFVQWDDFAETLQRAAKASSISPDALRIIDVAARGGFLVVLPEFSATALVRCYASAVAGGEVLRHALDPSVIGLDDIWRQPVSSIPTAFARAWVAARADTRRYRIVLLDGLGRTPTDLWLPSFLEVLNDHNRPANLLVFGSMGNNIVDPARAWLDLPTLGVPVSTKITVAIDAELTARATGRLVSTSVFDASAVPFPSQEDFADVFGIVADVSERWSIERIFRSFKAGWPHRQHTDLVSLIRAWCEDSDGRPSSDPRCDALAQGRSWLFSVLDPGSARKGGMGDA
jgi:hypothetical protein